MLPYLSLSLDDSNQIEPQQVRFINEHFDPRKYELLVGASVEIRGQNFRKPTRVRSDGRFRVYDIPVGHVDIIVDHEYLREPYVFKWYITRGYNNPALVGGAGYFLSIGIDRPESYDADNDAYGMHQVFDEHSTLYGTNRLLINEDAEKRDIQEAISFVVNDAKHDSHAMNYFVIYYSGPMGPGYLETWDSDGSWSSDITDSELNDWLGDFPGYVTVILEGHDSASFINNRPLSVEPLQLKKRKYTVITAAKDGQDAIRYPDGRLERGYFTGFLIEGLSTPGPKYRDRADSNKDGVITAREIYNYVKLRVEDSTNGSQTPQLWVGSEENTVILRYR